MTETEPESSTLSEGRSAPLLNMESGCRQTSVAKGWGTWGGPQQCIHACCQRVLAQGRGWRESMCMCV